MLAKRITIEVSVNLDQVPGWGYDPEDFVEHIRNILNNTIPHYKPDVRLIEKQ